jgi:hypothetical protein
LFAVSAHPVETYSQGYSDVERRCQRRGTRFDRVTHTDKKKKEAGVLNHSFNQDVNRNDETRMTNDDSERCHASSALRPESSRSAVGVF